MFLSFTDNDIEKFNEAEKTLVANRECCGFGDGIPGFGK